MKRLVSLLIVASFMVCMLVGCKQENVVDGGIDSDSSEYSTEDKTTEGTDDSLEESTGESESSEVAESTNYSEKETEPIIMEYSIEDARDDTSIESPAKLGEWVKSTKMSYASEEYETVYWRVVSVTSDCKEAIDSYNEGNNLYYFDELEDEDMSYFLLTYEVYFPEEFNTPEWGVSSPALSLSIESPDGGGIEYKGVSYIGLSNVVNISEPAEVMAGDTYVGNAIYIMIDDPSVDYIICNTTRSLGEGTESVQEYVSVK